MRPVVSVVIITKNNSSTIDKCITCLLNQNYPKNEYELIFVDGHSNDGTDEIIKRYASTHPVLKFFYEDRGTMGYARNVGIERSGGEIVAFIDGDAFAPSNWIENIVREFRKDTETAVVSGLDILVSEYETFGDKEFDAVPSMGYWRRMKRATGVKAIACTKTVNFAARREILLLHGGFDPNLSHMDETELMARIIFRGNNSKMVYDPQIIVYHVYRKMGEKKRWKKIFKKSMLSASLIFRRYMMKAALANPTSSLATSFYVGLIAVLTFPLLVAMFLTGMIGLFVIAGCISYFVVLAGYVINCWVKTRKFSASLPVNLTVQLIVRFAGTFVGLIRALHNYSNN